MYVTMQELCSSYLYHFLYFLRHVLPWCELKSSPQGCSVAPEQPPRRNQEVENSYSQEFWGHTQPVVFNVLF